ncbi:phospholipase-like protein, partial [Tanacetum coccineum]
FFPINLDNQHWVAASWNLDDYQLFVYDSLECPENYEKMINLLKKWKDFIKKDLESMDWFKKTKRDPECFKILLRYVNDMPRQSSMYGTLDCGVMTCKFIEMLTKGKTINAKNFGANVAKKCQEFRAKMVLMLYDTRCERPGVEPFRKNQIKLRLFCDEVGTISKRYLYVLEHFTLDVITIHPLNNDPEAW